MSRRLTIITVIALMILLSLTLAACEKERPVPTPSRSTPQTTRGTVAATTGTPSTPSAALTTVTAPADGTRTVQATPIPVGGSTSTTATAPQPVVVSTGAASGAGQSFIYTVVAGDTLAVIASRFNTTPEGIVQLNELKDANVLALGQQLKIPGKAPAAGTGGTSTGGGTGTTGTGGATSTYTVQAGDTLGKIAARYGTTVAALLQLNGLSNPDVLAIGQKLKVPGTGGAPAAVGTPKPATGGQGRTYVVQKGDTLLSIARRYGLTTKQLQAANNITDPDKIFPGQKLVIP
jgi:N-acetylmuramoyl-L-alanine amidase